MHHQHGARRQEGSTGTHIRASALSKAVDQAKVVRAWFGRVGHVAYVHARSVGVQCSNRGGEQVHSRVELGLRSRVRVRVGVGAGLRAIARESSGVTAVREGCRWQRRRRMERAAGMQRCRTGSRRWMAIPVEFYPAPAVWPKSFPAKIKCLEKRHIVGWGLL